MKKRCIVCDKVVEKGEGKHFLRHLIHKDCMDLAKLKRYEILSHSIQNMK